MNNTRSLVAALGLNIFITSVCCVLASAFLLVITYMLSSYGIEIPNGAAQEPEKIITGFGLSAIVCCFVGLLITDKFSEVGTPANKNSDRIEELETAVGTEAGS
ncbi:MAG: hypothetical protein WC545_00305 [Patescibacteria group bacterium]